MADKKDLMIPPQGGVIKELVARLKLIVRLMGDRRVSPWLKLIPIGALVYLVSPIDLIMGIPGVDALDDTAVLWLGSYLFIEFCPPDVVSEHIKALGANSGEKDKDEGNIVDADSVEIKDIKK
jgi:uncharacterized membrane protein YkvA (DUF1232 family)